MLKIEIGDQQHMDKATLRAVSAFLLTLAGESVTATKPSAAELAPIPAAHPQLSPSTIAADDKPDAGAPTTIDAAQAFGNVDKAINQAQAAAAFGVADIVVPTIDPATAFGNAGNVPAPGAMLANASGAVVASVPVPPTANVPAPSGVEVDRDGYPWDSRIHASSKVKNADGRWRMKRGVDDAFITQVQAELRQIAAVPTPTAGAIAAAVQTAQTLGNVTDTSTTAIAPSADANTNSFIPTANPVATIPTAPGAPVMDYATFIGKVTAGLTSNPPTLSQATLQGTLSAHGIAGLPVLATRQELVPLVAAALGFV